jgi:hypothetical protein
LGRIASVHSDSKGAAQHFSTAYQIAPLNPDAILFYADVVEARGARETLLRNFLAVAPRQDVRRLEVATRLAIDEALDARLGSAATNRLVSPYDSYSIPVERIATALVLEASLNQSAPLRLIVDTGASGITLNSSAARALGLDDLGAAVVEGFGSSKVVSGRKALARSFRSGDLEIDDVLVSVSDSELSPDSDGVVGPELFGAFLIKLDSRARRLNLDPLPVDSEAFPGATRAYRLGHLLLVPAAVNGSGQADFIVDTGSPYTLVSETLARTSGRAGSMRGVQGEFAASFPASAVSLRIDSRSFLEFGYAPIDTSPLSERTGTEIGGVLGVSILRDRALTLNYRDGLVEFAH